MVKLERYKPRSPDYSIQYNYIQFMLDLPWGEMSDDNLDLKHAQKILDEKGSIDGSIHRFLLVAQKQEIRS